MQETWQAAKLWSDLFIDLIRDIIGSSWVLTAPLGKDQREATDLIVYTDGLRNFAARMRRFGYWDKFQYKHDFSIRAKRLSGAKTEMAKILEGYGDFFFYGHANQDDTAIDHWSILSLNAFRAHVARGVAFQEIPSPDGTVARYYDMRNFKGEPALILETDVTRALERKRRRDALLNLTLRAPSKTPPEWHTYPKRLSIR